MKIPLETFVNCFQGLLPAQLFTCSLDGVPNAAYVSHVEYVDADHVASAIRQLHAEFFPPGVTAS